MTSKPSQGVYPILALLLAATLWGVIWYPLRLLQDAGLAGIWSTLIMYFSATLVGAVIVFRYLHEFLRRPWLLLLIALANGWANVAFILAVIDGNVVRVLLLFYLSPVWTVILGSLILGERLTRFSLITLVVAMAGAMFMLWDPEIGSLWPRDTADWLAISAGLAFAFSNVFVRMADDVRVRTKTFATWVGVTLTAGLLIVMSESSVPAVAGEILAWAVLLGILFTVVMTLAVQYGVTHMPVQRSAIILLFELVAGAISAQLLTDEVVLPREWLGGALILMAAYIAATRQTTGS
ncbi:MAG: DMT family transporter [Gammaproteobacteria bacterium]|nr:MAG: DMT family transporter [Gammaproteobacteria bacterium]